MKKINKIKHTENFYLLELGIVQQPNVMSLEAWKKKTTLFFFNLLTFCLCKKKLCFCINAERCC